MTKFVKFLQKNKLNILLIIILALSAFLRLYRISDYMTFLGDEGRDLIEVRKILSGNLVFLGPRSSAADFYYGPIYFYLITPFLWLSGFDPVGPAIFIALLGIATVYLIFHICKELIGQKTAIFAAALYSVSPLVIAYSRSSWNPNPLPFVALAALYLTYLAIKKNSWKLFISAGLLLGIAIQLQYLAVFLGAVIIVFTALGLALEKKTRQLIIILKSYISIFAGFIIGWSPFLAFELKHNFPNLKTLLNFIFFGSSGSEYASNMGFLENIHSVFFKIFARLITRFPPPEQVNTNENLDLKIWEIATFLLGILSLIIFSKVKNRLAKLLFYLWFFIGIFLFGFYKKQIHDYYLGFMFPLPFVFVGYLLSEGYNFTLPKLKQINITKKIIQIIGFGIFIALLIFNLDGNPFKNTPNRQKEQVKQIAEFIIAKTGGKPFNFALLTLGNSDHGYRYYFDILGHPSTTIEFERLDPQRKTITDQLMVVCEDPNCIPLGAGLWEVAGFGRAEIAGEWNVSVVKVYKLIHYPSNSKNL